jgi:hypothetical protein
MLPIDVVHHPEHDPGFLFRFLVVGCKIVGRQWLACFPHVAIGAPNAQATGYPAHDTDELADSDVLREHLQVLQALRRPLGTG